MSGPSCKTRREQSSKTLLHMEYAVNGASTHAPRCQVAQPILLADTISRLERSLHARTHLVYAIYVTPLIRASYTFTVAPIASKFSQSFPEVTHPSKGPPGPFSESFAAWYADAVRLLP